MKPETILAYIYLTCVLLDLVLYVITSWAKGPQWNYWPFSGFYVFYKKIIRKE